MPALPDKPPLRLLYEQCARSAHRRARRLLRSEDEAWDVVHDVFTRVAERGHEIKNAEVMPYFYRAVTQECLNRLKARFRRSQHARSVAEVEQPDSDGALVATNLLRRLAPHLDDLDREILVLHYLDGLAQEEVADIVGVWRRTIGRRLKRIKDLSIQLADPVTREGPV